MCSAKVITKENTKKNNTDKQYKKKPAKIFIINTRNFIAIWSSVRQIIWACRHFPPIAPPFFEGGQGAG